MPTKHWPLGPSGLTRYLNCVGSIGPCHRSEDKPSQYAEEGTAAHALLEGWLKGETSPDNLPDNVPDDMVNAVNVAYDYIEDLRATADLEGIEHTLEHSALSEFGGTVDYWCIHGEELTVVDYKHGAGVTVDAQGNPQLMAYLILIRDWVLSEKPEGVKVPTTYRGVIVQPRGQGAAIKEADFEPEAISKLEYQIQDLHKAYLDGNDTRTAGDWCRWCSAAASCPALQAMANEAAVTDFADVNDVEDVAKWLAARKPIEAFLKAIAEKALGQLQDGQPVPGFKLVERLGNRQWKLDEAALLRRLKTRGIGKRAAMQSKLKSPAQLEKDGHAEAVADLTHRPVTGLVVAPETDRREAVVVDKSAAEFIDLSYLD
jgi:hypothetical protein